VSGLTKIYLKFYNLLRSLLVSGVLLMRKELGTENARNPNLLEYLNPGKAKTSVVRGKAVLAVTINIVGPARL
jgi:hypothetical protein